MGAPWELSASEAGSWVQEEGSGACACTWARAEVGVCMAVCTCVHAGVRACAHPCLRACVHMCARTCQRVPTCLRASARTHSGARASTYVPSSPRVHARATHRLCVPVSSGARTVCTYVCMPRTRVQARVCVCVPARVRMSECVPFVCAYMHGGAHVCIHACDSVCPLGAPALGSQRPLGSRPAQTPGSTRQEKRQEAPRGWSSGRKSH